MIFSPFFAIKTNRELKRGFFLGLGGFLRYFFLSFFIIFDYFFFCYYRYVTVLIYIFNNTIISIFVYLKLIIFNRNWAGGRMWSVGPGPRTWFWNVLTFSLNDKLILKIKINYFDFIFTINLIELKYHKNEW